MSTVDFTSLDGVLNVIKESQFYNCRVYREQFINGEPALFELISNDYANTERALKSFCKYANPNNIYQIYLYKKLERNENDNISPSLKDKKLKYTFSLKNNREFMNDDGSHQTMSNGPGNTLTLQDVQLIVSQSIKEALENKEKQSILAKLDEIEERLDEIEESGLSAGNSSDNMLQGLLGALSGLGLTNTKATEVLNDETKDIQKKQINEAVQILWQSNKQLGNDLMKLALLSQKKPTQFNLLITNLRALEL